MEKKNPLTHVLVTCVKSKCDYPCAAGEMYTGVLFEQLMQFAKDQNPENIFILSGKYGLLKLSDPIAPYDVDLHKVSDEALQAWSEKVIAKLDKETDLQNDHFVYLTSKIYCKYLQAHTPHFDMPIEIR